MSKRLEYCSNRYYPYTKVTHEIKTTKCLISSEIHYLKKRPRGYRRNQEPS